MLKLIGKILLGVLAILLILGLANMSKIKRVYKAIHLFDEDVIVNNFQHIEDVFDVTNILPSSSPVKLPYNISYTLPKSFVHEDSTYVMSDFFNYTKHEGLLIIHNDTIVFEQYDRGLTEDKTHISWSMAKSVVATLVGIAHDDGLFTLDEPVTKYLPQLKGSGYDGVKIKDILQMSSGVKFNEDYGDYNSDINRFGRSFAQGSSLEEFAKSLKREREPGAYCHYVSIDTQVLGMLLKQVTGRPLSEYYAERLRDPLGMEYDAQWIIDNTGMEMALGGLNMTLRDYSKLGLLYLHEGMFNGKQIVSKSWIHSAVTPDAPHLMPGDHGLSSHNYGYGYQWWIPEVDDGDFFAAGIYNQYIYVQPNRNLVITKLTANHHFKTEGAKTKDTHLSLFKRIAQDFPLNSPFVEVDVAELEMVRDIDRQVK